MVCTGAELSARTRGRTGGSTGRKEGDEPPPARRLPRALVLSASLSRRSWCKTRTGKPSPMSLSGAAARRRRAKHVSLFSTWLGTPLHRPAMHRTQPVQQPVGISGETLVHNKPAVGGAGGALLLVEEKAGAPGTSTPHVAGGVAWARASRRRSFVSRIRDRDRARPQRVLAFGWPVVCSFDRRLMPLLSDSWQAPLRAAQRPFYQHAR